MIKRALISVSDKKGIVEFAKQLSELGIEIISTGGTAKVLRDSGLSIKDVSEVTGFPECLDGRVKTLHPLIHSGILAVRDNKEHTETMSKLNISLIDMVVVNLYPFKETILKDDVTLENAIENIDIGGPTMLRSAAKNYNDVTVVVDPKDYESIILEIAEKSTTKLSTRQKLATKVFEHTCHYDTLIANYLKQAEGEQLHKSDKNEFPETITFTYEKVQDLRYGENPHQNAAFYREIKSKSSGLSSGTQLHGKELSFNNINDSNAAIELLKEFDEATVVALKHTNPCGVASADNIYEAYQKAYKADQVSIFGGIIAANRTIDEQTAIVMKEVFLETIIAPDFTEKALRILKNKKNLRLIKLSSIAEKLEINYDIKKNIDGILIQSRNTDLISRITTVTKCSPSDIQMKDLEFAFKIVKHVKSNAIVIAKNQQTLAIGPGQTSRIWALQNAISNTAHKLEGSVLASDAFFPFRDCVDEAKKAGIVAIIQPGGSVRDEDSIKACDEAGISMIFTGMRHFKH
ncbi:MAG: bifunctional phosphoribosylaminoimidazolecarboxamide formyltransferase/inosine monophosphate cyclohydrolase [Alkaliphilus sp.]|nr:bifunctional phosphoribosylaminoimidazolecarboxamide formyltransferase/IMP cyclohydrolase [Alkaliphilus sp. AH-315-G20]MBN4067598.1 bifunctional phosphoribosylaminoimidazolecarboxamide formyltransferase/IMP cyclohydrolase [Alkaliphilus transvaalensis]PHS33891.1 MAG: bifunctional phosphoribosylaminoimidazolecarboxamide formyltransferase/inosine monophosphate cyclohydrolase [Alkaliphilus sp.]